MDTKEGIDGREPVYARAGRDRTGTRRGHCELIDWRRSSPEVFGDKNPLWTQAITGEGSSLTEELTFVYYARITQLRINYNL